MKNKKGFTLIELVGVIALLGLIFGVAVVGYIGVKNQIRKTYYSGVEESVKVALNEYYTYNKSIHIDRYGKFQKINMSELIDGEYIEGVKTENGEDCNVVGSFGMIYKDSYDKIKYEVCLICADYQNTTPLCSGEVDFTLMVKATIGNTDREYKSGVYTNQNVKLLFKTKNDIVRAEVLDESGSIYKSCNLIETNQMSSCSLNIESSGNYKIIGYGASGKTTEPQNINVLIDKINPTFNIKNESKTIINDTNISLLGNNNISLINYIEDVGDSISGINYIKYSFEKKGSNNQYHDLNKDIESNEINKTLTPGEWVLNVEVADKAGNITKKKVDYEFFNEANIPTATVNCLNPHYTGKSQVVTTSTEGTGYTLSGYNGTNVGDYTITATLENGYAWSNGSKENITFKCSILKADDEITITEKAYQYDASTHAALASAESGLDVSLRYYSDSSCNTLTTTTNADTNGGPPKIAGTYYVIGTTSGNNNYNAATTSCRVGVTIFQNDAVITCQNKVYNGETQSIASCTGGTVNNALKKDVGNYEITCSPDSNHTTSINKTCSITKSNTTTTLANMTYNYNGSAHSASGATSKLSSNDSTISSGNYYYKYYTDNACREGETSTAPTAAGKYYVRATLAETSNYNSSVSNCAVLTINKTAAKITCQNRTYTGTQQIIATCYGGTVGNEKQTNAGSYLISCAGDNNHLSPSDETCLITKSNTVTSLPLITNTYTGSSLGVGGATATLTSNNSAISGARFTYKYYTNSSCTEGETTTAPKNPNTYYAKATLTGTDNYNTSTSSCVRYVISANPAVITCNNKTYNGSNQVIASCTGGTVQNATQISAGNYNISCNPDSSHTKPADKSCSISKSTSTTTIAPLNLTYTGITYTTLHPTSTLSGGATITGGNYTYSYYNGTGCSGTALGSAPKDANTYSYKAVLTGTGNYDSSISNCANYVINEATPIVNLTAKSSAWTGNPIVANNATVQLQNNEVYSGAITYTYYTNSSCSTGATTTAPSEVGTYYVQASTTAFKNYKKGVSNCVSHTIGITTPTVTLTAKTANWTGNPILANTASVTPNSGGTITYTYFTNNTCTTKTTTSHGASSAGNAPSLGGQYYVKAYVAEVSGISNTASSSCVSHKINVVTPTVTLTAKSGMLYTGSSIASNTATVSPNGGGTITYTYYTDSSCSTGATTTAPKNVGQYYVKASVAAVSNKTNAASSSCVSHVIAKSNTTTTMSAVTKTFNNSNQVASGATSKLSSNSASISGGSYTYTYYSGTGCSGTALGSAPKTAGSYSVKATLSGTSNYNSSTSSCVTYTMNKYKPSITLGSTTGTVNFNSEATFTATPTVIAACKGKLTAASAGTSYVTISSGAETSDATSAVTVKWKGILKTTGTKINVNYAVTDTTNCQNADQKQYTAVVNVTTPTVSLTAKEGTYTGSSIAANTATVSPNGGGTITYTYYTDSSCSTGATTTAPTNVGQYYVKASVAAVTNKTNAASSGCISHKIVKSNTTTSLSAVTKTFNNSNQAASGATSKLSSNSASISGGSYTYTYYSGTGCSGTALGSAPKTAGSYSVKATLSGTSNYNSSTSSCVTYTMNKYKPSITLGSTTGTVNFNSEATFTATPTVITACKGKLTAASAGTSYVTISSGAETSDATSAVTVKWKGILKTTGTKINVNYAVTDTTNCQNADQKQYTAVVNVVTPTVSLTAKEVAYTGSSIAANTATVSPNGGGTITYTYYTDSSCSTGATTTAPTNVGQYYVKASVAAVSNKTNAASSGCISHKIVKSNTTTSLSAISKTYNGNAQAVSGATSKLSSNSASISGGSYTYTYYTDSSCSTKTPTSTGASAVGGAPAKAKTSYYVKATLTGTSNYNSSTSSCVAYTINKATPTITFSSADGIVGLNQTDVFKAKSNVIGSFNITSSATGVATVSPSSVGETAANTYTGNITITGKSMGKANITVKVTPKDTANYNTNSKVHAIEVQNRFCVTYNANGGTTTLPKQCCNTTGSSCKISIPAYDKANMCRPVYGSYMGYKYNGLATSATSATIAACQGDTSYSINSDKTLYAIWKPDVTKKGTVFLTTSANYLYIRETASRSGTIKGNVAAGTVLPVWREKFLSDTWNWYGVVYNGGYYYAAASNITISGSNVSYSNSCDLNNYCGR